MVPHTTVKYTIKRLTDGDDIAGYQELAHAQTRWSEHVVGITIYLQRGLFLSDLHSSASLTVVQSFVLLWAETESLRTSGTSSPAFVEAIARNADQVTAAGAHDRF